MFGDDCNPGCQEACLYFNYEDNALYAKETLTFPDLPSLTEVTFKKWRLSWSRPIPEEGSSLALVFVLLYKADPKKAWAYGGDTADNYATIDGELDTYPFLEFKILAISSKGIVDHTGLVLPSNSQSTSSSTEAPSTSTSDPTLTVPLTNSLLPVTSVPEEKGSDQQKTLQMSVILVDEVLEGILSITPPSENVDFLRITWVRVSCRVNHFLPVCHLPSERYAQDIAVRNKKQLTVALRDLTYNSAYLLRVTSSGKDTSYDETVFYLTPSCQSPDVTFLRCSDDPESDNDSMRARTSRREGSAKVLLVAFASSAAVVVVFAICGCLWFRSRRSDSSTFAGTASTSLPVPIITVDGRNYVSLEVLQHHRAPPLDQRRNISVSMPALLSCESPRPVRATSTPKDHARIV